MNEKKVTETYLIKAFWNVFGYFFVGITSFVYGIMLQIYNRSYDYNELLKLIEKKEFRYAIFLVVIIVLFYNMLFCHAYASLYSIKEDVPDKFYWKLGHWMESILVIIVMTWFIPFVVLQEDMKHVILLVSVISVIWIVCIILYRTFLVYQKKENDGISGRIKYRLIIPSMLMVATNIYVGSCIVELCEGKLEYYVTLIPLMLFVLIYGLIDLILYLNNIKYNKPRECSFEHLIPYVYFGILISLAAMNNYMELKNFDTPIRSLFLASFVAIYMGMFEGWFILSNEKPIKCRRVQRKYRNVKRKEFKNYMELQRIKRGIRKILEYMPIVVFVLFPFQDFQLIYIVGFIIGHIYTWQYWISYQRNKNKNPRSLAFKRAILGVITLVILMVDKWSDIDVTKTLKGILDLRYLERVGDVSMMIAIINLIISSFAIMLQIKDKKFQEALKVIIINKRIVMYEVVAFVIAYIFPMVKGVEPLRRSFSIIGCFIFAVFEIYLLYYRSKCKDKLLNAKFKDNHY